jgi:hypothetical protein
MNEPCKVLRGYLADSITKYGSVENWKVTPHCGCKGSCKRLENKRKYEGY